jgi:hypothetical protein
MSLEKMQSRLERVNAQIERLLAAFEYSGSHSSPNELLLIEVLREHLEMEQDFITECIEEERKYQ